MYYSHRSISVTIVLALYSSSSFFTYASISALIAALVSLVLSLLLLLLPPWPLFTSRDRSDTSTTQYHALFSPNHVYSWTAIKIYSSFRPFWLCCLLLCVCRTFWLWLLKLHFVHWNLFKTGRTGCGRDWSSGSSILQKLYYHGHCLIY